MKRLWIGVAVLIVLLCIGISTTVFATHTHGDISQILQQASESALRGNWQEAKTLSLAAKERWETCRRLTASIADHEPMEQIDDLFAQMELYVWTRQQIPLAACCASLSVLTEAMAEAHAVNWWSLL